MHTGLIYSVIVVTESEPQLRLQPAANGAKIQIFFAFLLDAFATSAASECPLAAGECLSARLEALIALTMHLAQLYRSSNIVALT